MAPLFRVFSPNKRKINASQPCSSWAQNKGGVGEPENRCAPATEARARRYSQLAETVEPRESTTGVLYRARNLVMVQIPGQERERRLTIQPEFSTLFNIKWEKRQTPTLPAGS